MSHIKRPSCQKRRNPPPPPHQLRLSHCMHLYIFARICPHNNFFLLFCYKLLRCGETRAERNPFAACAREINTSAGNKNFIDIHVLYPAFSFVLCDVQTFRCFEICNIYKSISLCGSFAFAIWTKFKYIHIARFPLNYILSIKLIFCYCPKIRERNTQNPYIYNIIELVSFGEDAHADDDEDIYKEIKALYLSSLDATALHYKFRVASPHFRVLALFSLLSLSTVCNAISRRINIKRFLATNFAN